MQQTNEQLLEEIEALKVRIAKARRKVTVAAGRNGGTPTEEAYIQGQALRAGQAYQSYFLALSQNIRVRAERRPFMSFSDNNVITLALIELDLQANLITTDLYSWEDP